MAIPTPTTARPVIVGSGYIANRHANALAQLGVRPLAVWSPNKRNREAFACKWGAKPVDTLDELIAIPEATHVHVCSPPVAHEEAVNLAARRGLSIICEKPLAPTGDGARRIVETVKQFGADFYVTFNRRLDRGIQELRHHIAIGTLGRVISIFGAYRQQWNASPSSRDWRFDPAQVGPSRVVTEIGSHWLDLAEFVLNQRIQSINAIMATMGERCFVTDSERGTFEPPNEDLFSAQMKFSGGAVGHVYGTQLAHGAFDDIELRVDGSARSAIWTSARPNQLVIAHKEDGVVTTGVDTDTSSIESCIEEIYAGTAEKSGIAGLEDGLSIANVADAILLSQESNAWMEVAR